MDFRGDILANFPPRHNEIWMGGPREVNETRSNGVSRYSGARYNEVLQYYYPYAESLLRKDLFVAMCRCQDSSVS